MPALTTDRFVRIAPLFLIALCLLALPGPAPAWRVPPPDASAASAGSGDLPLAALRTPKAFPPTTVKLDDEGYTIWSVDWSSGSWCVPVSVIRYPLDLGGQDPGELEDATLKLYFSEGLYHEDVQDTSWTVALNGKPPDDWRDVDTISGPATYGKVWTSSAPIEIDTDLLIDGVNNIWLRQHDVCPQPPGCDTCACTCIELRRVELRAALDMSIKKVSPAQDTKNLALDQSKDPEIQVTFSAPPDPETVNENTFQVFYHDHDGFQVLVKGEPRRITPTKYGFVSQNKLRDGIRYFARVWGQEDAEAASRDEWIAHETGEPLEEGRLWSFWTIPELDVKLVAAQVLEVGALNPLVVYKPTVLRVFVRWDLKPDVYHRHQARDVELHDVVVSWTVLDGSHSGDAHWKEDDYRWRPVRDARTGVRKREYREYTSAEESYSKHEKLYARDSVNYFGFKPMESGSYTLGARVEVKDSRGEVQPFRAGITRNANAAPWFGLYMRAAAVGAEYGKTGTVDLSAVVKNSVSGIKAIYPAPNVTRPAAPAAMSWYNPTSTFWFFDWSTSPAQWKPKTALLQEMDMLCARTTGCRAMIALVPGAWLVDLGLTAPESAPRGAMVVTYPNDENYRFLAAHEIGHLARFEHITEPSADGFDVGKKKDRRYSVSQLPPQNQRTLNNLLDFMNVDPVESPPPERLWISKWHYITLGLWTGAWRSAASPQWLTESADTLLLAAGGIVTSTGEVHLLPWYQLDPGSWTMPEPGPYTLVFLDGADQEIVGYAQPFTVTATLQPAGVRSPAVDEPVPFTLLVPFPSSAAKVQIWKSGDGGDSLLEEVPVSATAPTLSIDPPGSSTWNGAQLLSWQTNAPAGHYALDLSTDGGATWEGLAIHLAGPTYTLETAALPNTAEAWIRVSATDGLRTTTEITGPFTIDNPPLVGFVSPSPGATWVGVDEDIVVGFRDPMDPATINGATVTLIGGQSGAVTGAVTYDAETGEATLTPRMPLAYTTTYTASVTTGVQDATGDPLPAPVTWSFTTEGDRLPPEPLAYTPRHGTLNVPFDAQIAVVWDKELDASTINTATFKLATLDGAGVSGTVAYQAATRTATLIPQVDLAPETTYVVTLTAGIEDAIGNQTVGDYVWSFTTGDRAADGPNLTGAYADYGVDSNGDGLYEELVVAVGVQVTATGEYGLKGTLADSGGAEITWANTSVTLQPGASFVDLIFDGASVGGHGVDGPYTLTGLTLVKTLIAPIPGPSVFVWKMDAYRTFGYGVYQFPAPLRFSGLPDLQLSPDANLEPAFNVRDYAEHITQTGDNLNYLMLSGGDLGAGVTLNADGSLTVNPKSSWAGGTDVTVQASYGDQTAQDTFRVTVGWVSQVMLPLVVRNSGDGAVQPARSNWFIGEEEGFEESSFPWAPYSSISIPPGGSYVWARRDCAACSGQYSAWPFGEELFEPDPPCGANYPDTLRSKMCLRYPINLAYTSQAELRMKVWTDLAPGDQICAMASADVISGLECWETTWYYGVCRSGTTDGWEDLVLDLANVPLLGSLLGQEEIWIGVHFIADESGSRPIGAYVDDVQLRVCPVGLTCDP